MYLLRLQPLINGQTQLLKQVAIYYADGSTIATLFDPRTEQPISNVLKTDASGFVTFKVLTLTTLTFRLLTGLTLSPTAYPLFSSTTSPTPPSGVIETEVSLSCGEMILEGYAVKTNSLGQAIRCSANNLTHLNTLIGIAKQTGNIGDVIAIAEDEFFTNTAWTWVPDKPVFLGANGTLTQSTTGLLFVQQVGVALSPTKIVIRISQPIKRL
jgi:hypothetical protein